ncbi:MAG: hrpB, partial [Verrucomicrobiales bacterium]|nr:hrpB [Verrucomicrobiales bacterium]
LGRDALEMLEVLLPTKIDWMDGKSAKLAYPSVVELEEGEYNPELQVKIQECFRLTAHPTICEGKLPLKLWLSTSDGKRLDATLDWPKYRTTVYPKHKTMLQKKFPGFAWP